MEIAIAIIVTIGVLCFFIYIAKHDGYIEGYLDGIHKEPCRYGKPWKYWDDED